MKQKSHISFFLGLSLIFCFFGVSHVFGEDFTVDATVPAICGNDFIEGAEECDDGNAVNGDGCTNTCTEEGGNAGGGGGANQDNATCGNSIVEGDEQCDDGNNVNNDMCSNLCHTPVCGNGIKQGVEQCDDANQNDTDMCSNTCQIPTCGDGKKQGNEQCDDGNIISNDGCSNACIPDIAAVCGDSVVNGAEQCDDGNIVNGDGCSNVCSVEAPVCGNSVRQENEQCDDGNAVSGDGCSNQCVLEDPAVCGNNNVEAGEQCDDGNIENNDGCSNLCQDEELPVCGNGIKEWQEQCDDGNVVRGDGCNEMCQFVPIDGTVCGNGVHEVGEECDDGNRRNGDGCTDVCQEELGDEAAGQNAQVPEDGNENQGNNPDNPLGQNAQDEQNNDQNENQNEQRVQGDESREGEKNGGGQSSSEGVTGEIQFIPVLNGVSSEIPLVEKVKKITTNISQNLVVTGEYLKEQTKQIAQTVRNAADDPAVEQASEIIVAPVTVAVVAATVAPSLGGVGIPLIHFLFFQPLLLFGRKKRKDWGQVYNSLTKLPVDLALVRLIDPKTKRVVQSRVTDTQGRYLFFADPGEYNLEITKQGFHFPSKLLQGEKIDGKFLDLYHGEALQVTEKTTHITPNIPLDPVGAETDPVWIKKEKYFVAIQQGLSALGIFINALSAFVSPVPHVFVLLGVQIILYILFRRFVKPKKPKGWGIVYENTLKKPVGTAVVRLFTKKYNKLVSTQVTDKKGRYAFLVGPSEYYVTFEKKGYRTKQTGDITIGEDNKEAILKQDVNLEREQ